ncbi:CCHC-type domain-containing protein [Trichonephila clavipes]|nr:CCHC-type domain-containing protein [Trichonephila clavipes]
MAYLGEARKEDLMLLAEELNLNVGDHMKIADLSKLITKYPDYDEEFSKNLLTIIVEDRKLREQQEMVREQQEFENEKKKLDREFQLEKLRLENEMLKGLTSIPEAKVSIYELTKVVPKFEMKDGDIVLFFILFERQAKRVSIKKRHWISALLALMPSEINQLMAREAEENFDDYNYIKGLLLKRFKLSAEMFRQKIVKHQRNPAQSWRGFVFEITSYFEE